MEENRLLMNKIKKWVIFMGSAEIVCIVLSVPSSMFYIFFYLGVFALISTRSMAGAIIGAAVHLLILFLQIYLTVFDHTVYRPDKDFMDNIASSSWVLNAIMNTAMAILCIRSVRYAKKLEVLRQCDGYPHFNSLAMGNNEKAVREHIEEISAGKANISDSVEVPENAEIENCIRKEKTEMDSI